MVEVLEALAELREKSGASFGRLLSLWAAALSGGRNVHIDAADSAGPPGPESKKIRGIRIYDVCNILAE